jgi:hypothetical protein
VNTESRPVVNPPAQAEARNRDHAGRRAIGAENPTQVYRGPETATEVRPVDATARLAEAEALIKRLHRIERHPGWQSRAFQWLKAKPDLGRT